MDDFLEGESVLAGPEGTSRIQEGREGPDWHGSCGGSGRGGGQSCPQPWLHPLLPEHRSLWVLSPPPPPPQGSQQREASAKSQAPHTHQRVNPHLRSCLTGRRPTPVREMPSSCQAHGTGNGTSVRIFPLCPVGPRPASVFAPSDASAASRVRIQGWGLPAVSGHSPSSSDVRSPQQVTFQAAAGSQGRLLPPGPGEAHSGSLPGHPSSPPRPGELLLGPAPSVRLPVLWLLRSRLPPRDALRAA